MRDAYGNYVPNLVDESPANTTRAPRCNENHGFIHLVTTTTTTTPMGLPLPPVPTQLFGGRDDDTDAHVGCNDFDNPTPGIAQINVYRATAAGGPYTLIGNFDGPISNLIFDATLLDTNQYYYVLKTLGDGIVYQAVESAASAIICALLAPQNLTVDGVTNDEGDFSWNYSAPQPALDYQIQWSIDSGFGSFSEGFTEPSNLSSIISGLNSGTHYFFRLRARDSANCVSDWSQGEFTTS